MAAVRIVLAGVGSRATMTVENGYEPLADAFREIAGDAVPAALVVRRDDEIVIDVSSGHDSRGRPFRSATPVFLFSAVKPVTALAVLLAVVEGQLELDAPITQVWPAFGAHGKDNVTVAQRWPMAPPSPAGHIPSHPTCSAPTKGG